MRVICTLPNCSTLINGWTFVPTPSGWVSEELPAEVAANFVKIPGYAPWRDAKPVVPVTEPTPTPIDPSTASVRPRGRPRVHRTTS
jgi:hypothetical protein